MKFRSISNWQKVEELSGLLFFAQRIDEMTFSYTIDSYKAPTTSIPSLLTECLETIENYEKIGKDHRASLHILDELSLRLRRDKAVAKCVTLTLDTHLAIDRSNADIVKSKLRVLKRELSAPAYLNALTPLLKTAIIENKKGLIDQYSRELISSLQTVGLSSEYINKSVRAYFFSRAIISSSNDFDRFLEMISPKSRNYCAYTYVNSVFNDLPADILEAFDLKIIPRLPASFPKLKWIENLPECPDNSVIIQVSELKFFDEFSAVNNAVQRITLLYDLLGIFHHKTVSSTGDFALIVDDIKSPRPVKLPTNSNKMHFISDNKPQTAAKEMKETITSVRLLRGSDSAKFMRVIDFHGMALRATAPENQLLNLWTALETIVPASPKASIVDGVMEGAIPFIGLNYVSRLANSVTFDLLRWNRPTVTNLLDRIETPDSFDIVEKIFSIAVCKEHRVIRDELFSELGSFELLRNRVFALGRTEPPRFYRRLLSSYFKLQCRLFSSFDSMRPPLLWV